MRTFPAALALVFLASACYKSGVGTHDSESDPTADTTPDPLPDPVDVPVDVPVDMPMDVPTDLPVEPDVPPPPRYSVTFVIENASPLECSSCVYYLQFPYFYDAYGTYGLGINWNGEDIVWETPFCTVGCEGLTDPMYCCIDCAAPMPAVRQLTPGQSTTVFWDGSVFTFDSEPCECGCYWQGIAPAGAGTAMVCAFPHFTCWDEVCEPDEYGVIPMAEGAGDPICTEADFSFPADDGGEVVLSLRPI
jgi:hypothetical protein